MTVLVLVSLLVAICKADLSAECLSNKWPNITSCVEYSITADGISRNVLSNSVPSYHVEPYCPFGVGGGYCAVGEINCPFKGMICPAQSGAPVMGDVIVPTLLSFSMPVNPDPTDSSKPSSMYQRDNRMGQVPTRYRRFLHAFPRWPAYNRATRQINFQGGPFFGQPDMMGGPPGKHQFSAGPKNQGGSQTPPATIGVHLTGVPILGPDEAGGINVDVANIYLECGGHVTPPVRSGPMYHFHKAPYCNNIDTQTADHAPLIGWAMDGFGIYGFNDVNGTDPVLDECRGHFGPVPASDNFSDCPKWKDQCSNVTQNMCHKCALTCGCPGGFAYHYHASNITNTDVNSLTPYILGCQGPSKGQCKTIVSDLRGGSNYCYKGCGSELCVQPGSSEQDLKSYVSKHAAATWLDTFSINSY